MKRKKSIKKIEINKVTIAHLNNQHMTIAKGGSVPLSDFPCPTANPNICTEDLDRDAPPSADSHILTCALHC